jgi:hypothetical protein
VVGHEVLVAGERGLPDRAAYAVGKLAVQVLGERQVLVLVDDPARRVAPGLVQLLLDLLVLWSTLLDPPLSYMNVLLLRN